MLIIATSPERNYRSLMDNINKLFQDAGVKRIAASRGFDVISISLREESTMETSALVSLRCQKCDAGSGVKIKETDTTGRPGSLGSILWRKIQPCFCRK